MKYDAVVIGGGPGGYECAIRLAQNGQKTALVEEGALGGTCLNRGCIPTKSLLHSAELYHSALNSADFGVKVQKASFDYKAIIARKNAVTKQLSNGVAFLEKSHGVDVYNARGILKSDHVVVLSTGEELEAANIVLATGSLPASIPVSGTDLPGVHDSTSLLELDKQPKSVVIVGGGVIGVEFATFFNRLGIPVTIIEMIDRILGPCDADISAIIAAQLSQAGVTIHTGARVKAIEKGLQVKFESKDGKEETAKGEIVLIAGGRRPNTESLGLSVLGIQTDKRGFVKTDGLCRTNFPHIYAIGDVNGAMMLAHVASAQGLMVADQIAGKPVKALNMQQIPSCVYCAPEVAMIGLTEAQALETGRKIGIGSFNIAGNGKAMTLGENAGIVKLIFDEQTEEILGCHIAGPRATDLIGEISAVMASEGTITEIGRAVHPHPTINEILMEAAHDAHGLSVNAPKKRRK